MKQMMFAAGITALPYLPGCKEEKEVKTVQWYTKHPAARQAQLDICEKNLGQLKVAPTCINATQSHIRNSGGSVKDRKLPGKQ